MVYFQANTDSPIYPDLRGLLLKTSGLVNVLSCALKPLATKIRAAFVYGSIASGQARTDSDIDLIVVGGLVPQELAIPLRRARDLLGREINPTVFASAEFDKRRAAKDPFLTEVMSKPQLLVIGSKDELGKAAG